MLRAAGHTIVGTTRSSDKAAAIAALGAEPVVVDVFDASALARAVLAARPQIVLHQLTDLAFAPGTPDYAEGLRRNARLRVEGTRNLVAAARAAGVSRLIAQSIGFVYAAGEGARVETDPLDAAGPAAATVAAVTSLESAVLAMPEGIVLRYGYLYGPGTWYEVPPKAPSLHVDAAAHAALLAVSAGGPGLYNVAEDDGALSIEKARRELRFDPAFRLKS
jgi:nucleoside-diphosphate-sugar epimerase